MFYFLLIWGSLNNINKKIEFVIKHLNHDASKEAIIDAIKGMQSENTSNYKEIINVINAKSVGNSTQVESDPGIDYTIGVKKIENNK